MASLEDVVAGAIPNVSDCFPKGSDSTQTKEKTIITRSSWLNCALRDDESVYWVSIGYYEAVAVGN